MRPFKFLGEYFCQCILLSLLFPVSYAETATGKECVCGRELKPVCGSDGHTYENECQFRCAQVLESSLLLRYHGACCPPASLCTEHRNPVCDDHGNSYENECHFEFQKCVAKRLQNINLKLRSRGKCGEETTEPSLLPQEEMSMTKSTSRCEFECPDDEDFVCDTNGITHQNTCFFERILCALRERGRQPIGIEHDGKCNENSEEDIMAESSSSEKPEATSKTTTTSTTSTTSHPALAFGTKVYDASRRQPSQLNPLPQSVPYDTAESPLVPLQSSNNTKTAVVGSRTRPPLPASAVIPHEEQCSAEDCDKKWDPVCDNKNNTHRNMCLYQFRVCKMKKSSIGSQFIPEIVKKGACNDTLATTPSSNPTTHTAVKNSAKPEDCKLCDDKSTKTPVCDNTNHTHQSACLLAQWNCKMRQHKLEERVLVHVGACRSNSLMFSLKDEECPKQCTNQYKPVCDSQGMTHPNLCTFQMFNCRQRKQKTPNTSWLISLSECQKKQEGTTTKAPTTTSKPLSTKPPAPTAPLTITKLVGWKKDDLSSEPKDDAFVTQTMMTQNVTSNDFECPEPLCPEEKEPICDNEGTIHKNLCMFAYARCLAARGGKILSAVADEECSANRCRIIEEKSCDETDKDYICGTDFHTYNNECLFTKAQCLDSDLEVLFKGKCEVCLTKPCPIVDASDNSIPDSELICDQNGETKTLCEFDMIKCIYEIKLGHNITEAYTGRCCPTLDSCPSTNQPVCDTRNQQHRNLCHFQVAQCRVAKIEQSQTPLTLRNNGTCKTIAKQPTPVEVKPAVTLAPLVSPFKPEPVRAIETSASAPRSLANSPLPSVNGGRSTFSRLPTAPRPSNPATKTIVAPSVLSSENHDHEGIQPDNEDDTMLFPIEIVPTMICEFNCTDEYEPICGSDGITYISKCHYDAKKCQREHRKEKNDVKIEYEGACCTVLDCWDEYSPVCDNLGRSHLNLCVFSNERCVSLKHKSANLTINNFGLCPGDSCEFECPKIYQPICGSNGETYVNECELRKLNCVKRKSEHHKEILVDYPDECCEVKQCPEFYSPVCDANGKTHVNKCVFEAEKCVHKRRNGTDLVLAYEDACCQDAECPEDIEEPICDGEVTHKNWCTFRVAQCEAEKKNTTIFPEYSGVCCQRPSGVCAQSGEICDTDGTTHKDRCEFEYKRCIDDRHGTRGRLQVAYEGKCCEKKECPTVEEPVCDSAGKTHRNPCFFQNEACNYNKKHPSSQLTILYDGECCADNCGDSIQPVCDDKRGVHLNLCKFNVKKCEAEKRGSESLLQVRCDQNQLGSLKRLMFW
uniref:Serine protease inhibitor n=2 Tax=Bursaphelenchus xylophilus TaxID=6326 RepID=A0A1I7RZY9_BURXY